MNSPVCKRSLDYQLSCNTKQSIRVVTSLKKKKNALTFLISKYNWLHFTRTEGRGNVHARTAASINTKTALHPTTDSALRLIILMVVNIFHSSTMALIVAVPSIQTWKLIPDVQKWAENDAHQTRYSERERQGQRSQHAKTPVLQKMKNLPDKAAGRIIEFSNDILKICTKVKTAVENCRLLQHPLLCKILSKCLLKSRSK